MKSHIIFTAMLGLALAACKKKAEEPVPKEQIRLLSKITTTDDKGASVVTEIAYDSQNRMIKKGSTIYAYTGDDLASMTTGTTVYTFTYDKGVPTKMHVSAPPLQLDYTYTVIDGRVVKRERSSDGYSHQFIYTNHNCTTIKVINSTIFTNFEFGLDKNPYYNPTCKYMLLVENEDVGNHYNQNLISDSYYQQYPFLGSQYSYIVGVDGYPKSVTVKTNPPKDPDSFIYKYLTFEYVMRDVVK